jgi:DNA-binding transcriptional LysR family regulator
VETPLFERTSFGVRPTREAGQLARRVRLAFAELEQAWAEVSSLRGGDRGRTVIGAMPLARSVLVPQTVLEFACVHPEHSVEILDGPYESMLESMRVGAVDVLIGALRDPPPGDDVVQEHLFDDPLAIVVRADHPLARRRRVQVHELARYPWITPRHGAPLRRRVEELFRGSGVAPPAGTIDCNSLVAARALLLGSDRVMLLSAHQIHHELAAGELVALPHPNGRTVRAIGLTWRRDWRPTATQAALLEALRENAIRIVREGAASARYAGRPRTLAGPAPAQSGRRKARGDTRMRTVKKRLKYAGSSKPR